MVFERGSSIIRMGGAVLGLHRKKGSIYHQPRKPEVGQNWHKSHANRRCRKGRDPQCKLDLGGKTGAGWRGEEKERTKRNAVDVCWAQKKKENRSLLVGDPVIGKKKR